MILKPALAAMIASGLIVPEKPKLVFPKPAIIKAENLELTRHILLGMPLTMGMLARNAFVQAAIAATAASTSGSVTSYTVSLPTGIVAGNLLIAVVGNNGDRTHTWPAGWTELTDDLNGSISSATIGYRVANGSEGASITVTASSAAPSAHVAVRITGSFGTPVASSVATGSSTAPDSSVVSRGNGRLYLAIFGGRNNSFTINSPPSGYTTSRSSITGSASAAIAFLQSSAATSDPSAWSLSGSCNWVARTVAV